MVTAILEALAWAGGTFAVGIVVLCAIGGWFE